MKSWEDAETAAVCINSLLEWDKAQLVPLYQHSKIYFKYKYSESIYMKNVYFWQHKTVSLLKESHINQILGLLSSKEPCFKENTEGNTKAACRNSTSEMDKSYTGGL